MTVTGKLYFFVSGTYRNQLRNTHLFFRVCVIQTFQGQYSSSILQKVILFGIICLLYIALTMSFY